MNQTQDIVTTTTIIQTTIITNTIPGHMVPVSIPDTTDTRPTATDHHSQLDLDMVDLDSELGGVTHTTVTVGDTHTMAMDGDIPVMDMVMDTVTDMVMAAAATVVTIHHHIIITVTITTHITMVKGTTGVAITMDPELPERAEIPSLSAKNMKML